MTWRPEEDQLAAQRRTAQERLAALRREFDDIARSAEGTDDEHDPEGATIAFERQHVAALIAQASDQLTAIDSALGRLADGSYGRCEQCGQQIAPERLAARPAAATCIRCAGSPR